MRLDKSNNQSPLLPRHADAEGRSAIEVRRNDTKNSQAANDVRKADVVRVHAASNERSSLSREAALLKEIIVETQRKITSCFKDEKAEIKSSNETVLDRLDNLERVVMKTTENVSSLLYLLSKKDKKKKSTEKDKKLDLELSLLESLFSEDVVERLMEHCTVKRFANFLVRTSPHDTTHQSSLAFSSLMISKPVGAPVSLFASGVGEEHSLYRKSIMVSLFDSVRDNVFNQFEDDTLKSNKLVGDSRSKSINRCATSSAGSAVQTSNDHDDMGCVKPQFPKWLKSGYITDKNIEHVRNAREVTQAEVNGPRRSKQVQLNRNDVANEAVDRMFKVVINRIKNGRESGKNSFFQEVGYLFVVWSQLLSANVSKDVSQESVDLQWYVEMDRSIEADLDLRDIAITKVVSRNDLDFSYPDDDPSEDNISNVRAYAEFIEENPQMILQVSHDVLVKTTKKGKRFTVKRKLVRFINLLDVAARVLPNFVGVRNPNSPMSILSSSPEAIKCLYGLACVLRGLIDAIMTGIGEQGGSVLYRNEDTEDAEIGEYKPIYYETLTVGDLLPSKTRQLKSIAKCITLTEGEFKSLHETGRQSDNQQGSESMDRNRDSDDESANDSG